MLRKVNTRREGKAVTYAHIIAGCKAFDIMHDAGLPENLAIRSLRDMINVYASEVHHGREVMVSVAARGLSKSQIILEHGTPRTELTRLFLKAYHAGERASNEFTEYRRSVGVEEVVPGRRRSLVNFHSFRRDFITKAEQADQMEHIIAVVVGRKRTGMTLGRYSGGPLLEQAGRCVEAVRLPFEHASSTPSKGTLRGRLWRATARSP